MSDGASVQSAQATTVLLSEASASALVVEQQVCVLTTGSEQGLSGPPGPISSGYDHSQPQAAYTWTIAHNKGARPSVSTFSTGGVEIEGTVQHLSSDVLIVSFVIPVAGYAHVI